MPVSYAQNFEDVMLWRALGHIESGRYIDIGAQHPIIDSVSLMFYEHGWRGIHVEPTPPYAELLRQARPEEVVIQAAIVAKSGVLRFYEFPDTGLSTGNRKIAEKHLDSGFGVREIVVPGMTLDEVLSRESGEEVHWLKIDVEGGEKQVLKGWIHSALRPWVVLIESTVPLSKVESHKQWESLVLRKGYKFAYFDGLNRFYIADGHAELFKAFTSGPNVFDGVNLSGTASSSWCVTLNSRIRSLEDQRERERQEAEKLLSQRQGELSEQMRALQVEAERVTQASAIEQKELNGRLQASHAEFAKLSQTLTDRERAFAEQVKTLQSEALVATQNLAARERDLGAQLVASHAKVARSAQTLAARENAFNAQLLASQQRERELDARLRIEREANNHLQLALNSLRNELAAMCNALSWRLTAPFRTVAGWFYPANLQSGISLDATSLTPNILNMQKLTGNNAISETMSPPSSFFEYATETGHVSAAPTLEALLRYQDWFFIECAYLTILQRSSDPAGLDHYLARLRAGAPKVQILAEISESLEALSKNVVVPGLRAAVRKYKLARLPFMGRFLRLFFTVEGNSLSESRLRTIEQQIFLLGKKSDVQIEQYDRGLNHLQALVDRGAREGEATLSEQQHPIQARGLEERERVFGERLRPGMKVGSIPSESGDVFSAALAAIRQWPLGRRIGE
jgi:FkbM family methyltransferase